jgi:hypothetical protein
MPKSKSDDTGKDPSNQEGGGRDVKKLAGGAVALAVAGFSFRLLLHGWRAAHRNRETRVPILAIFQ